MVFDFKVTVEIVLPRVIVFEIWTVQSQMNKLRSFTMSKCVKHSHTTRKSWNTDGI